MGEQQPLSTNEIMAIKRFPAVEAGFGCLLGMELPDLVVRQPFDESPELVGRDKNAMLKAAAGLVICADPVLGSDQ